MLDTVPASQSGEGEKQKPPYGPGPVEEHESGGDMQGMHAGKNYYIRKYKQRKWELCVY